MPTYDQNTQDAVRVLRERDTIEHLRAARSSATVRNDEAQALAKLAALAVAIVTGADVEDVP